MDVVRLDGVGGERQRWFVYASFGHAAADLDRPVSPRQPHAELAGNAL